MCNTYFYRIRHTKNHFGCSRGDEFCFVCERTINDIYFLQSYVLNCTVIGLLIYYEKYSLCNCLTLH
jgi:hypothetical protein